MALAVANNPILAKIHANRAMIFPFALISLLMVILVPLPTSVLDLLLIVNISVSALVLMVVGLLLTYPPIARLF